MRNTLGLVYCWIALTCATQVQAVDFESFEFNDSNFTALGDAVNTANPGNTWSTDINDLIDSSVQNGVFHIIELGDIQRDSYLQIDNVNSSTVGSRYIVVRMAGWEFFDNVPGDGEEIRFDFLDNDTGIDGSFVTAQVRIDRNTDTEAIELRGTALGVGSSNIATRATLNTAQSAPFTMVLELNKTSNHYEVFWKDGSNPSQYLGQAPVASIRDGNSVRFTINNNFGSDFNEFFDIDRIAVTDTNPLSDLLTLQIDRISGEMKLINSSGAALSGLESVSLTSAAGALDGGAWKPITDNYDNAAGPGDGSVDSDNNWSIEMMSEIELTESVDSGNGGNLAIGQQVVLNQAGQSTWVRNLIEDIEATLTFAGGVTRRPNVNFVGNGGKRFEPGDLNFDGLFTAADWTAFITGSEVDLTGLSQAAAYQLGDLNNDGQNNIFDFSIFKNAFETANGVGSFAAMLASVPEPSSFGLLTGGLLVALAHRRRTPSPAATSHCPTSASEFSPMRCFRILPCVALMLALSLATTAARAELIADFQFNDSNGTVLADAANSVPLGANWIEDTTDMTNSSVQSGVYRIQKNNEGFGTNYLNNGTTDNITSGKGWVVAEIAGWNFTPTLGAGEDAEEIRFAFLDNDDGTGSTITGQAEIQRNGSGGIELIGGLLNNVTDFGPLPLTHTRSTPFTVVLEIDEDAENYSVWYKDNTDPFVKLGTAPHVAGRDGNSVRMVVNNHFGGAGEFFDLDRLYVTTTDPINVVEDLLTLEVNTLTGELTLRNETSTTFEIDSYRLSSTASDSLFVKTNWNSLSSRGIDAVGGGDDVGETWDEAAGADNEVLAESFLLGSSTFGMGREISLGFAFNTSADANNLMFQYRNADTGAVVNGNVIQVSTTADGDFDGDGDVDGADLLRWQRGGSPTPLSAADLADWEADYGAGTGGALAATSAVPEPGSAGLFLLAGAVTLASPTRRR